MSQRITLYVRVRLLSDTIFGAGFSVPGGEDIAVCEDSKGYPYLKTGSYGRAEVKRMSMN